MKKYILSGLISVIITGCFAQAQLPEGKIKGKHDTFKVHHGEHVFNNQKFIYVYSTKNKYNDGIPFGKNEIEIGPKDIHIDKGLIKSIINEILHDKLQALHKNHERIGGSLVFDLSGMVTDVSFSVRENTLITPVEFEEIDNKIRAEIKATFTGKAYLTHVAINGDLGTVIF